MALMGEGSTSKLCDSCDRQTARLLGSSCATLLMALLMSCLTSIPGFVLSCWPFKTIPCLLENNSKFYFVCADFPPVSCLLPFVRRRFASTLSTFTCTICHFCIGSSNGCLEKHFHFHCFAGLSFTFPAIVSWLYLVQKKDSRFKDRWSSRQQLTQISKSRSLWILGRNKSTRC